MGASTLWGVGNSSLKVDDADKGYNGGPKKQERLFQITNLPRCCD